jgi:hypothetical protein
MKRVNLVFFTLNTLFNRPMQYASFAGVVSLDIRDQIINIRTLISSAINQTLHEERTNPYR